MAEYRENTVQTVAPGATVVFSKYFLPCKKGYIFNKNDY